MNILGIGTEIVECLKIAQMIERHGELFLARVFTERETEFCSSRRLATQHFAGHWVGKEAILKALGTRWRKGIHWRDLEIERTGSGAALVTLSGGLLEFSQSKGVSDLMLSISHCRSHATAHALAIGFDMDL